MARSKKTKLALSGKPCVLCAGGAPGSTVDHVPPIVLFTGRIRPKGLEFPSCQNCNSRFGNLDQVAAYFLRANGAMLNNFSDEMELAKLLQGIANNSPEVLGYIGEDDATELLIEGLPHLDGYLVPVRRRLFRDWLNPWAARIGVALWYHHTSKLFEYDQRLIVRWLDVKDVVEGGVLVDRLVSILSGFHPLEQGRKKFSNQFAYRFAINDELCIGGFLIICHSAAACFVAITSSKKISPRLQSDLKLGEMFRVSKRFGIEKALPEH